MEYRITVICKERHFRETFSVEAPTEGKAKTRAMMKALDGDLHVEGELVEYEVVNEKKGEIMKIFRADEMEKLGFQYYGTGGGCTAWFYKFADGREFLITDTDGLAPDENTKSIYIGIGSDNTNGDGEEIEVNEMDSLDSFLEIWS